MWVFAAVVAALVMTGFLAWGPLSKSRYAYEARFVCAATPLIGFTSEACGLLANATMRDAARERFFESSTTPVAEELATIGILSLLSAIGYAVVLRSPWVMSGCILLTVGLFSWFSVSISTGVFAGIFLTIAGVVLLTPFLIIGCLVGLAFALGLIAALVWMTLLMFDYYIVQGN